MTGGIKKEYVVKFKLILLSAMLMAAGLVNVGEVLLKTDKDMLSYSIGASTAKNLKKSDIEIDLDLVMMGLKDGLAGDKLLLTDKQISAVMNGLMNNVKRTTVANRKQAAEKNQKAGLIFLEANKQKEGVVTLPSGVQYLVLKAGSGKKPSDSDMVVCSFRGTLIDGTVFEATEEGLAVVTLNRPDVHNAFNAELIAVEQMRVNERRQQVVREADRMAVARQVQVEVVHRNDL